MKHVSYICNQNPGQMKDSKVDAIISQLEKYVADISKSEAKSKKFLIDAGIITEKGNLKKNYKHLCIPHAQD